VLQLMNAHDPDTSEQRYLEVIHRKTARLFEAGAQVAAVLSGAAEPVQQALARYGRHLGAAFQLIDDVLDYRSDPATRGKNLGEDLAEGKPTLPLIHALRGTRGADHALLRAAVEAPIDANVDEVIALIDRSGGIDYTRSVAQREAALASEALAILPTSQWRDALAGLAMASVERDH
jgi:octaprenyl-diphosphate synthase